MICQIFYFVNLMGLSTRISKNSMHSYILFFVFTTEKLLCVKPSYMIHTFQVKESALAL